MKFVVIRLFILLVIPRFIVAQSQQGGFYDQWDNYPAGTFGSKAISFDTMGLRSIDTVASVGIHPRIYFGPDDKVDIKTNLETTTHGQEVFAQMHAYTTLLNLGYSNGGSYQHNSSYGSDAFGNRRISNAGKWDRSVAYAGLVSGDLSALNSYDNKSRYLLASVMALEAMECYIMSGEYDDDTGNYYDDRAIDLGKAMSTWAQIVYGDPQLNPNNYNHFGGVHMAYAYDLNYNAMTASQQDSVRMALGEIVIASPRYGLGLEPYATTSNWVGLNSFEILTNMAIEGETGYNPTLMQDYMLTYRNFLTYGWYESGTPYEGLGKNYQFVTTLIAAAKRGYSLLHHPHVRNYGTQYLPHIIQPYGHAFIGTDVWGGSGWNSEIGGYKNNPSDILGLKWSLPDDNTVDFVWRNYIEKWYGNNSSGYVYQHIEPANSGYHNYLLLAVIFTEAYQSGSWSNQNQRALGDSSFLAPERGLATLRSGFEEDDMMIHYHCRQDLGGHTNGDRNTFAMSALGRIWFRYTYGSAFQETKYHSCVLIDDLGIPITNLDGRKARQPGVITGFVDSTLYTTVSGDATHAYSYEWHWSPQYPWADHPWLGSNGWSKVTHDWNDFRYQAGTEPYHSVDFYDYGHWNVPGRLERMVKREYNLMEKVHRTLTLVKTYKPFVITVDDIKKDAGTHDYKWLGQIANDLVLDSTIVDYSSNHFRNDLIMLDPISQKRLLVRILNSDGQCSGSLMLTGAISSGTYNSQGTLTADGVVEAGEDVVLQAGSEVVLQPEFEVQPSASLEAEIIGCNSGPAYSGYWESIDPMINGNNPITRLVVEAQNVVEPDFRIMLYPYQSGDALPLTSWNSDMSELSVDVDGEQVIVSFIKNNGVTQVSVE